MQSHDYMSVGVCFSYTADVCNNAVLWWPVNYPIQIHQETPVHENFRNFVIRGCRTKAKQH